MTGMNCVVDAACASSLIAVKVAVQELLYGDCDTMIAGATCTDNSIGMYMAFSKTPVFSTKPSVTSKRYKVVWRRKRYVCHEASRRRGARWG